MGAAQSTSSALPRKPATPVSATSLLEKQLSSLAVRDDDKPSQRKAIQRGSGSATVTLDDIDVYEKQYQSEPARKALGTILSKQDILANLTSRDAEILDTQVFNVKLTTQVTPVTNQKQSGRCWLFAALNMARLAFAKKYNTDEFQFSQAYPFFWDHLEKSNFFLENIIDLAEEEMDSRMMEHFMGDPVSDGGEWAFAIDLFERYGLVPQPLCPESFSSSNSAKMDELVNTKLREYSLELRKLYAHTKETVLAQTRLSQANAEAAAVSACRVRKTEQLGEIYTVLSMCLGTPPSPNKQFKYEFYDKKGQYHVFESTPLELYKALEPVFKPADNISLVNQPNHELGKLYTMERGHNVYGGRDLLYVNTEIEHLEQAVVKMLKADEPVWFACDSRSLLDRDRGIWDTNIRDYEGTFGFKLGMTKAERLTTGASYPSHAMMISGVHVENGKPVRYRIENSWGPDYGSKGYFVCTSDWFKEYVYEVVVPRKYTPAELLKILDAGNAKPLPPWATMRKRPSEGM